MQVLRMFNGYVRPACAAQLRADLANRTLSRKKESHKRNLHFHVPVSVPCHPSMRLLQSDSSYVTMGDIYENFCNEAGIAREQPFYMVPDKFRQTMKAYKEANGVYVSGDRMLFRATVLTAVWCAASEGSPGHPEEGADGRSSRQAGTGGHSITRTF